MTTNGIKGVRRYRVLGNERGGPVLGQFVVIGGTWVGDTRGTVLAPLKDNEPQSHLLEVVRNASDGQPAGYHRTAKEAVKHEADLIRAKISAMQSRLNEVESLPTKEPTQ